ncbi:MAG: cupredoxin domain-containing protein [Candidatus Micrarchaeota archaeon]
MKTNEMMAVFLLIIVGMWAVATAVSPPSPGALPKDFNGVQANSAQANPAQLTAPSANSGAAPKAAAPTGQQKTFKIRVDGGYYNPREITVNQGDKVRLELDPSTFRGCMTVFNVWGYGIRKYVSSSDNVVEFTADKAGTFKTSCNMGMGDGKFIVVPSDGSALPSAAQTQAAAQDSGLQAAPAGSCGGGSGGCGCGGG